MTLSLSYYLDLFNVFNEDFKICITEPNQRYIKTKYLLKKNSTTSLVIGSSRVGRLTVPDDGKWYNFTSSESLISENIEDLNILYNNGVKLDTILLGIDNIPLYVDESNHHEDFMRMGVNELKKTDYLIKTLSIKQLLKKILTHTKIYDFQKSKYNLRTGNVRIPKSVDLFMKNNPIQHEKKLILSGPNWNEDFYRYRIDKFKSEMLEMKRLTLLNKTELIVFINPIWIKTFERIPVEEWLEFIEFLNHNFEYTDFNEYQIISNPKNYHDNSHYNYEIGELIFNRLRKKT